MKKMTNYSILMVLGDGGQASKCASIGFGWTCKILPKVANNGKCWV